jgi:hypothetical protein
LELAAERDEAAVRSGDVDPVRAENLVHIMRPGDIR